jgi:hypothetical protein
MRCQYCCMEIEETEPRPFCGTGAPFRLSSAERESLRYSGLHAHEERCPSRPKIPKTMTEVFLEAARALGRRGR